MSSSETPRLIALYLPQFHPIPENDAWWGKGFTEWTNVAKARPLFEGHYQPHIPADLGFYDLRLSETRQAQADLASQYGVGAFCYYHYWFAGRRILERPFNEVLTSGKPDFPFCLCWANHSWRGVWMGLGNKIFIEQTYPGDEDTIQHFYALLPAFKDRRYLTVEGKPIFTIFDPFNLVNARRFIDLWQELAIKNGLPGIHFVGQTRNWDWDCLADGFDAAVSQFTIPLIPKDQKTAPHLPTIHSYEQMHMQLIPSTVKKNLYSCISPGWDNTPRSGANGVALHGSTPELFRSQLRKALDHVRHNPAHSRIIYIRSWNEWAQGNHLEPDLVHGCQYLEVIKTELEAYSRSDGKPIPDPTALSDQPGAVSPIQPHGRYALDFY